MPEPISESVLPEPVLSEEVLPEPVLVDADGTEVATWVLGPADRPPLADVLLCHGTPWSAQVWAPVARALSQEYRVFLWDMPGYGASVKEEGHAVDLVAQRERLAALVRHWALDRPHIVAHDIGGAVALGAHLLEGVELTSLFLLDIVTLDPWGSPFFRLVAQHEQVFTALPAPLHGALVKEYIAGAANGALSTADVDVLARPWSDRTGQAAFYRQIAQLSPDHTAPIVSRLGAVRCPVRIGWGVDDPWIPFEQAERLRSALPGPVEVVEFPARGHLVPLEDADGTSTALLEWLGAWGGSGRTAEVAQRA